MLPFAFFIGTSLRRYFATKINALNFHAPLKPFAIAMLSSAALTDSTISELFSAEILAIEKFLQRPNSNAMLTHV